MQVLNHISMARIINTVRTVSIHVRGYKKGVRFMKGYQLGASICMLLMSHGVVALEGGDEATKLKPKIRVEREQGAPEIIPTEEVRVFLQDIEILKKEASRQLATVVALDDERLMASMGSKIYVKGLSDEKKREYRIYKETQTYYHPKTKEALGVGLEYVGKARPSKKLSDDTLELMVTEAKDSVVLGYYVMATEERLLPYSYQARPAETKEAGYILDVSPGGDMAAVSDVVLLSLGEREGLLAGETLGVYGNPRVIEHKKERLEVPGELLGKVLVYRTFDKMSLGLVLDAKNKLDRMAVVKALDVAG